MGRLIVFAGLPGSGKSTLASALADQLDAILLNKDVVRAALFANQHVEYSARQNDFCMDIIYQLAGYHFQHYPDRTVIIDGRTYCKRHQVEILLKHQQRWNCEFFVIECVASLETLLKRVNNDAGKHLAQDRTADMVQQAYVQWECWTTPRLTIQTDETSLSRSLELIQHYITENEKRPVE